MGVPILKFDPCIGTHGRTCREGRPMDSHIGNRDLTGVPIGKGVQKRAFLRGFWRLPSLSSQTLSWPPLPYRDGGVGESTYPLIKKFHDHLGTYRMTDVEPWIYHMKSWGCHRCIRLEILSPYNVSIWKSPSFFFERVKTWKWQSPRFPSLYTNFL